MLLNLFIEKSQVENAVYILTLHNKVQLLETGKF